jgi:lysophospholipase L1-like esterase
MQTLIRLVRNGGAALVGTCVLILLLEVSLRPAAYFWHGRSEYYLYYGFHSLVGRVGINPMTTFQGEYYKLPPQYVLRGAAGQASETASTNALGFRGRDFAVTKAPGVFRVVCLGESSTFGYRNGDAETYPFYLQKLLEHDNLQAEVINAGFPYYNTGSILSLLKNEILSYEPDLITLYAAYNDTSWPTEIGTMGRVALWVQSHSITHLLAKDSAGALVDNVEQRVYRRTIPQRLRDDAFMENDEKVARRYRMNVEAIIHIARSRNIPLVVIKQPVTRRRKGYETMSYEQEYQLIKEKFAQGSRLTNIETWMLKQHHLMTELDAIAREAKLPVVDNIRIVDQDRRRLASWVHLTSEGNQRLAEALKAVIEAYIRHKRVSEATL